MFDFNSLFLLQLKWLGGRVYETVWWLVVYRGKAKHLCGLRNKKKSSLYWWCNGSNRRMYGDGEEREWYHIVSNSQWDMIVGIFMSGAVLPPLELDTCSVLTPPWPKRRASPFFRDMLHLKQMQNRCRLMGGLRCITVTITTWPMQCKS